MSEHPLVRSQSQVRAILNGATRFSQVIKPQPVHRVVEGVAHLTIGMNPAEDGRNWYDADCINPGVLIRPKYRIGDTLWVKETWKPTGLFSFAPNMQTQGCGRFAYRADEEQHLRDEWIPWRPSTQMPRWAARIFREITDVRVQRIQDITEEDAIAEGAETDEYLEFADRAALCAPGGSRIETVREYYLRCIWDRLNAKRGFGWEANPWVFAYTFKVKEKK